MEPNEHTLTRAELLELHSKFREIRHNINNTFAVIMALSELGQRNPTHLEKLAKAVLQRTPDIVQQMSNFGEMLNAKVKGESVSRSMPMSEIFPPAVSAK